MASPHSSSTVQSSLFFTPHMHFWESMDVSLSNAPLPPHTLDDSHAPATTINALPNELMLSIFPLLPLKDLIPARGVSKDWRNFIEAAFIPQARRALLELYLEVIKSPSFLKSRGLLTTEVKDIDREEYVSSVERETGVPLPEEFRLWVLEWPTKAIPTWLWPGLDSIQPRTLGDVFSRQTMNLLKAFGIRPRKIHLCRRSTTDDTVVLRPMRYNATGDAARDWCWMLIVQVTRDPFAMDFLLFGGEGLGTLVTDTVLVVKDDVVRPGMGWVEYMRKELQKQDESYLKKLEAAPSTSPEPECPPEATQSLEVAPSRPFQSKVRRALREVKNLWSHLLTASRTVTTWRRSMSSNR